MDSQQKGRYLRQISLPEVGPEGQEKLLASKVLIIGLGGLGTPAAIYLAAAGVGTIGLADYQKIELSNLNRQFLYNPVDVNQLKTDCLKTRLLSFNPSLHIELFPYRLNPTNAQEILQGYHFIIDAADNLNSKLLINDAAFFLGIPYVYGGISGFSGHLMTILPGETACFRCITNIRPKGVIEQIDSENNVLGAVAGVIGALQAIEAIKVLLNRNTLCTNSLLLLNTLSSTIRKIHIRKNKSCTLCGENPTIHSIH